MKPIIFFLSLIFFFYHATSLAASLKGLALVHLHSKKINKEFNVGLFLSRDRVDFFAIDDFGGVPFTIAFDGDRLTIASPEGAMETGAGGVKKLLSLPVKRDEFLAVLNYDKPRDFNRRHEADGEFWQDPKNKKLSIVFADFRKFDVTQPELPMKIRIAHKKYFFELTWQKIEVAN